MTRLWLVRHGPTHAKTMVGWTDLPADLTDRAAVARLERALPQAPVVSSTLTRAVETANAIAADRPRLPALPDLREMHFGSWENRRWADVNAQAPDHIRAFWETPGDVAPPGGESWHDLDSRVSTTIDTLLDANTPDLIVVCHFGPILTQLQRALGVTTPEVFAHKIEPLSVTRLTTAPWGVEAVNHAP